MENLFTVCDLSDAMSCHEKHFLLTAKCHDAVHYLGSRHVLLLLVVLLLLYLFCVQRISGLSISHSASFTSSKCKASLLAVVLSNMRWNLSYACKW